MKAASAPRREERPAGEKEQKKEQTKKDGETPAVPAVPEAPTHIPGRLFVGGLPRDVTPDALSNLLGAFGVRVEHVEFNTKHVPILGTNFAFVDVSPIEKTSVCVAKLNRTKWKGQSLRVELAKPSRLTKVLAHIHASDDEEAKEEAKPETAEEKKAKSKEGKRVGPWKRGKAGRLLPVLTLEKKNGRGTFIHDPAKTKHNITIFPSAMMATPDVPLSRLTYFYDESTAAAANATATNKKTNTSSTAAGAGAMDTDDADEAEPVIVRPPSPRPANDRVSAKLDREREFSLSLIESLVSTPPGSPPAGFDDDKEDDEEGYGGGGYDDDNEEEAQGQHDEFKAEWEKSRQNAPCLWQHGPERKAERAALQQQQQQKATDRKQAEPKPQAAAAQAAKARLEKERTEKAKLEREKKAKMEEEEREKAILEKEREEKARIEKEKREKEERKEKAKMEKEKEKREKERKEKEKEEKEKARVEKEKKEKEKEERKKAKALKSAEEEEEGLDGMAVVEEEHTVVTATTTTTTTTQATASETMETEEKREDEPKSSETDQSGLRVGERGWWTSMLSTAAAAAAAPTPDAPKEASFSLFSILPTPPPVEESKKTKAGGKAVDPAIASALRSMKAAPKAAGTTSSPAGAGATTRKRPAPVVAPKRFLSACQDDDYSGPAFMRPDNWEQAEEEWASSRQALSHDYKSKFKTARKRQRATTADPSV